MLEIVASTAFSFLSPAASLYRRVLHDYERASGLPRSLDSEYGLDDHRGFPEMCPCLDYWFMPMTRAWQEYQFALLTEYSPVGMSIADRKKAWRNFYDTGKAICNRRGFSRKAESDHRDYINGMGDDKGLPALQSITMGGNVVKVIGDASGEWVQVETLDGNKPPPSFEDCNRETHPWLVHVATVSTPFGYDGLWTPTGPWRVDSFPHNRGAHCCFPFVSRGPQFIRADRLGTVILPHWPYNP